MNEGNTESPHQSFNESNDVREDEDASRQRISIRQDRYEIK